MLTGIATNIILNKITGKTKTQMSMPKTPTPSRVRLTPYMRRTGRRGQGFTTGLSKPAPVEGSRFSPTTQYNLTLRKLLKLSTST